MTLFNVLHHNWPLLIVTVRLYTLQCYIIISSYVAMPTPNCYIRNIFSLSTYIKHFMNDVISAATFQDRLADILAARWYSVIHSTPNQLTWFIIKQLFVTDTLILVNRVITFMKLPKNVIYWICNEQDVFPYTD
jgi:hypothetical protein